MVRIAVSHDAARYLLGKMRRPNVVVYRDIFREKRGLVFIPRIKAADGREPEGNFDASNHAGITVWVEKEFLRDLTPDESIIIGLEKGLIKSLKVDTVSEQMRQVA